MFKVAAKKTSASRRRAAQQAKAPEAAAPSKRRAAAKPAPARRRRPTVSAKQRAIEAELRPLHVAVTKDHLVANGILHDVRREIDRLLGEALQYVESEVTAAMLTGEGGAHYRELVTGRLYKRTCDIMSRLHSAENATKDMRTKVANAWHAQTVNMPGYYSSAERARVR